MKYNRAWKRKLNLAPNRAARRNAAHVLARLEVLAVTSVNPSPLTDNQLLAALNVPEGDWMGDAPDFYSEMDATESAHATEVSLERGTQS